MTGLKMYYWSPNEDGAVFYRVMCDDVHFAWMKDLTDLGGSGDDFAGDLCDDIQRVGAHLDRV